MHITIGSSAGHVLKPADITVAYHVTDHRGAKGLMFVRKWLADRKAFDYDPRLGWAYDRWFKWSN